MNAYDRRDRNRDHALKKKSVILSKQLHIPMQNFIPKYKKEILENMCHQLGPKTFIGLSHHTSLQDADNNTYNKRNKKIMLPFEMVRGCTQFLCIGMFVPPRYNCQPGIRAPKIWV